MEGCSKEMTTPYNFTQQVAYKVLDLLMVRKAMLHQVGTVFYLWERGERIIVAFDPSAIDARRINDDFVHELSTRLHGRRVVHTNSRGVFLQVGFDIPAAPMLLTARPLDLALQPTPWHMPVGMTKEGTLWISLLEGDSFLIGGSRGGGKTGEEHAWIQALLHGGKTLVYAWDGKRGAEFGRYAGRPNFNLIFSGVKGLEDLQAMLKSRESILTVSGYPNIVMHNEQAGREFIPPIALFVDEAADLPDLAKELLKSMIRLYRHAGLYPIIATNQPTVADVFTKTNLSTRVAFRVPHHNDSITMLGYRGAELLPDERGRGLIVWKGKFIEFQSFNVDYPMPSEETRQMLSSQVQSEDVRPLSTTADDIAQLADSIQEQWTPKMSGRAVAKLLGKSYGGSWKDKVDRVIVHLAATTTTGTLPDSGTVAV
jgi:hypothetical protein